MSYFLKKTRNKKGLYLQIYSGSMSRERGHVVQSCYRSLGYYDDLVAGGISDPVAHFQEEVDGLNAAEKMRKQADKGKKIGVKGPLRSIGYFPCVLSRENPQIIMRNSPVLSSPYQEWEKRVIFIPPFAYS